jgi:hypothetical protein
MDVGVHEVDEGFIGFISPLMFWCSQVMHEVFKALNPTL